MKKEKFYDIVILGAGASGLMCASLLPKNLKVLLIDSNSFIGAKIRVSGGGKCNVVNENISKEDFLGDREFLTPLLQSFTCKDILNFFDGVEFEKKKKAQYFCKHSSSQITDFFKNKSSHCDFALNETCLHVRKCEDIFTITCKNKTYKSRVFVVSSGGLSYPKLGASNIGYEIAKSFAHEVTVTAPALVGFTAQKEEFWAKELSGISLHVRVKVNEKVFEDDLLFSHKGFSGPAVLNASLFWQKGKMSMDFMPRKNLFECLKNESKKQLTTLLPLPKRFIKTFLHVIGLEDKPVHKYTQKELEILADKLHNYTFSPAGNFGYTKAEVTRGGVSTKEIDPLTYESKKVKNLFFLGEVLDITGRLGGYNFYFAFGSAMMMSKSLQNSGTLNAIL